MKQPQTCRGSSFYVRWIRVLSYAINPSLPNSRGNVFTIVHLLGVMKPNLSNLSKQHHESCLYDLSPPIYKTKHMTCSHTHHKMPCEQAMSTVLCSDVTC
jgi:hypothetical protein